ncbi:hypothetical protein JNM05_05770 [bacterium]|nr:hypothetical protein [bacterium]
MKNPHDTRLTILGQTNSADSPTCSYQDELLIKDGWERRFIADERMAKESEATYLDLGFEVKRIPFESRKMPDDCQGCESVAQKFCIIYTKKLNPSQSR